jgi:hypothetical protein
MRHLIVYGDSSVASDKDVDRLGDPESSQALDANENDVKSPLEFARS